MIDLEAMRKLVGLHRGVSYKTYGAWPAVNFSTWLKKKRTMAHVKWGAENPKPPSAAMNVGSALHLSVFEPERALKEVVTAPKCDRRTKEGKAAWALFVSASAGKIVLEDEEVAAVCAMQARLRAHPRVSKLVAAEGPCEAAVVWIDKETDLPCKARLDKFLPGVLALDLKTTRSAAPEDWPWSAAKFGYDQQAAHYYDGFSTVAEPTPFCFVCIENEPPHECALYVPDEDTIAVGRSKNRAAMKRIAECLKTGVWPGYSESVVPFRLPAGKMELDLDGLPKPEEEDDDDSQPF